MSVTVAQYSEPTARYCPVMRRITIASLLALAAVPASAGDPPKSKSLGDGYELVVDNSSLNVLHGKQRARLAPALELKKVTVDKPSKKVTATVEDYSCAMTATYTWTFSELDARMENTAAYALHRKKDYKGSSAGFAKAVAADPAWKIAAINLASAQQLLGDKDAAIKTLTPWMTNEPIATYVSITTDPELSPLLDRPEVKALRAAKAGDAKLTKDEVGGYVAIQPDKKLIAVARSEASWGACAFGTDLEIYDLASVKLVATTPIIRFDETADCDENGGSILARAKKPIAKRVAALQTMLRDLGFKTTKTELGSDVKSADDGGKTSSNIKNAKLGVVVQGDIARVFRKNDELGSGKVLEHLHRAVFVSALDAVVVWSGRPGAEGCEGTDPTLVTVIPVKQPAAAATPAKK